MKQPKKEVIKLSESYNRATNLELDFKDSARLNNIYLSSKFQTGLKEVFASILEKNSKHRVRVLSGSPGLGKSTFALLVARIVSKKNPKIMTRLFDKSTRELKNNFSAFQKSRDTKLLPVFINGYQGNIEEVFIRTLKTSLSEIGLTSKIRSKNTLDFYKKTLNILKTKGYSGVFVIYDEFGKYLEKGVHNPTELNIQFLQDFAEFCDRSGERQCHLMLITHLSVSQYASQLPIHVQQEWAKIEGRFQESAFYDKSSDYYKLISSVFEKNISQTQPAMAKRHKAYVSKYIKEFAKDAFESFIDSKETVSILMKTFPLHPGVLALLPHLSQKVAQNERTLYTFLTRDENHSLKRFMEESFKDEKTLLMPYDLYKYFSPLIGKDIGIGGTYKIQLMAEEAFRTINKSDEVSKQVISLVALCSVVKDSHFAPLTEEFIISFFNQSYKALEIKKSLKLLKNKRVVFYNRSLKQYLLQEGTPIDIDEEISKLKTKTLTGKSLVEVLKRYFKTDFIIPRKYNSGKGITRFYRTEIISVEELKALKKRKVVDFYREDGVVFYVIPFSHDDLVYAKSEIPKIQSTLTVFVLPKQFIECRKDIEELNAVDCLYNNKDVLSTSPLVKKELDRHKDILLSSIQSLLKPLIGYMKLSVEVFYQGNLKEMENSFKTQGHFKELQRFLGNLFEKEYNKYVSFNLEYVNRHSVSGNITLARKKFIDLLISNKTNPIKNIKELVKGRGPDYAVFHTLNRLSKFDYNSSESIYKISQGSDYYVFLKEYKKILSDASNGISGETLLDKLVSPPYGLRLGVIPLFISLADLCFKQPVSHYFDSAYVKDLDGDHYDLLMKYPKKVRIHHTPINTKQQKFLDGLGKIFNSNDLSINSVIEGLLRWRKTIPESTKSISSLSKPGRKFLIQVDSSKEPDKLLFEGIPECFEKANLTSETNLNEIQKLLNQTKKIKSEIDLVYRTLLSNIKDDLVNFVVFINKQCLNRPSKPLIINENLIKSSQKTLSQIKDYPFSVNTNRFIGRVLHFDPSKPDQYFLETVSDALTGSSPRHWNAQGYSQFQFATKQVKTEVELACEIASPDFKGQSVLAFIDKGEDKKTFLKLGSCFDIDQRLARSVEKVKIILDSLDDIDKKKAILAVLQLMDANSLDTKDKEHKTLKKKPELHV